MKTQTETLAFLTNRYPSVTFKPGDTFYWSPSDITVYYEAGNSEPQGIWALLHETGHAILEHEQYYADIELVQMEMQAWEKAKLIANDSQLDMVISEDHIQDCLDSYRDWLHKRSLCPDCSLSGIQIKESTYSCIFCYKKWKVTKDRFCRPYRKSL